jgi:hypothetical protein
VLFSVAAEDLYSYRVIHISGTAKLIELPIEEKHVPNIYLNAVLVSDAQLFEDTKQVVVPPVQQFLSIDVKADREQYQPREEGTLSVTARDANGKPVAAEIGLGLVDESVKYIQQDYAGDPRQFYYGNKRSLGVQTQSTFNQKAYSRLVEVTKGRLVDSKYADAENEENRPEPAAAPAEVGGVELWRGPGRSGVRYGLHHRLQGGGGRWHALPSTKRIAGKRGTAKRCGAKPVGNAALRHHLVRNRRCKCAATFVQPSCGCLTF